MKKGNHVEYALRQNHCHIPDKNTLNIRYGSSFVPCKIQKAHFSLHQSPQMTILVHFNSSSHTFIGSTGAAFSFLFPVSTACVYIQVS